MTRLAALLAQFADPAVALAAPRVVALPVAEPGLLDRYEETGSPLDMGAGEGPVMPVSALSYVPSATIVVRCDAVGTGFDDSMRVGEDVDLCMRPHEAGWRLRYVPTAGVGHRHRTDLRGWLAHEPRTVPAPPTWRCATPGRCRRCMPPPGRWQPAPCCCAGGRGRRPWRRP
ncbi:hypothetical protein [Streptomyces sp. NPDC014006]|uniref:hypothetical protein n=1 Tax=Streptomyces sp. NPDC014006 TaxID=3364870 RepID=UPI0036F6EAF7